VYHILKDNKMATGAMKRTEKEESHRSSTHRDKGGGDYIRDLVIAKALALF
jgi:hypothetical protein